MEIKKMEMLLEILAISLEADLKDEKGNIKTHQLMHLNELQLNNVYAFINGDEQNYGEYEPQLDDEVVAVRTNFTRDE